MAEVFAVGLGVGVPVFGLFVIEAFPKLFVAAIFGEAKELLGVFFQFANHTFLPILGDGSMKCLGGSFR